MAGFGRSAVALCVVLAALAAGPGAARAASRAPATRYVALGDSEASAPGVPRQVDPRCGRSSRDYPALVAARLPAAAFTDATCAGATTADLARRRFGALRPDTTLVTLTIGANDIGFATVITRCTALGLLDAKGAPCRRLYGDRIDRRIAAAGRRTADALRAVRRLAPRARVVLAGYLNLIPDDHRGCRPRELFAAGDLAFLDREENALDAALAAAARDAGALFADDHPASAGHDMCRPDGVRWSEAILPTRPAVPFHPNASGEAAIARRVLAVLGR